MEGGECGDAGGTGSVQQVLFCHLTKLRPNKENKAQVDAEAHYHFQNLFLSFFFVYIKT